MRKSAILFLLTVSTIAALFISCTPKCASTDGAGTEIWLGKTHVIAPSAFTPNNHDGINDVFKFVQVTAAPDTSQQSTAALQIKDFRMEITKGGEFLFETYAWSNGWNGKNSKGKKVEGLVNVTYSISDYDGHVSEGNFSLFVVPSGCLQECMQKHIFGDMIHPYDGVVNQTAETFCH